MKAKSGKSGAYCPLCRSRMLVNARIPRLSGMRIQYRCPKCGKTKTVKER